MKILLALTMMVPLIGCATTASKNQTESRVQDEYLTMQGCLSGTLVLTVVAKSKGEYARALMLDKHSDGLVHEVVALGRVLGKTKRQCENDTKAFAKKYYSWDRITRSKFAEWYVNTCF